MIQRRMSVERVIEVFHCRASGLGNRTLGYYVACIIKALTSRLIVKTRHSACYFMTAVAIKKASRRGGLQAETT